jgi:hypothetical protein
MKELTPVAVALVSTILLVAGLARAENQAEQTVVVPKDSAPFKVSEGDLVRLTGHGIAGSQITAKVDGPAKIAATYLISTRVAGNHPIGVADKEFDVKPTGKGQVTVTITVKPPQPDAQPKETTYTFEVE